MTDSTGRGSRGGMQESGRTGRGGVRVRYPERKKRGIPDYREGREKAEQENRGISPFGSGPGEDDEFLMDLPRERHYRMNGLHICVDNYSGGDIAGRVYSKLSRDALKFGDVGELLLRVDALFDERGYPQNFQEKRSFAENPIWDGRYEPPKTFRKDADIFNQKGTVCTIDIVVVSRRRASWQGMLLKGDKPVKNFQSAKELIELLLADVKRRQKKATKSD